MGKLPRAAHLWPLAAVVALALALGTVASRLSAPVTGETGPLLWATDSRTPSYLFATIHVSDARVLDLAPVVVQSLAAADTMYTEIPFDTAGRAAVAERSHLAEGVTLKDVVAPELYARVKAFVASKKMPFELFETQQVWLLATTLPLLDYLDAISGGPSLDQYLRDRAVASGSRVDSLETLDEQVAVFRDVGIEEQVRLLEQTLDSLETAESQGQNLARELVDAYVSGDLERLYAITLAQIDVNDAESEAFLDRLLTQRNRRMAERIEAHLRAEPDRSHFFAIGAAHFVGADNLIELLADRGIVLRRVDAAAADKAA